MASQGPLSSGTIVNDSSIGTDSWDNPGRVVASDDSYAATVIGPGVTTNYIKATNFGFTIPAGSIIGGIVMEAEVASDDTSVVIDDAAARIVKQDTIGATDKSNATQWKLADVYLSHGDTADLWGETWTAANINDSTFGTALAAVQTGGAMGQTGRVDHVRITVHYTEGGGGTPPWLLNDSAGR